MLFGLNATVFSINYLRIISCTHIHCNHIPGPVELHVMLHTYQLDNHKSRNANYTFFNFERTSPCFEQDNRKYNRFLSSSTLTKVYLPNERGIARKSPKLNLKYDKALLCLL